MRVKLGDRDATISSGAKIGSVKADGKGLKFELVYFSSEPSHTLIAGLKPKEVIANGKRLPKSIEPLQRKPGWWWDEKSQRAYVTTPPANQLTQVQLLAE